MGTVSRTAKASVARPNLKKAIGFGQELERVLRSQSGKVEHGKEYIEQTKGCVMST